MPRPHSLGLLSYIFAARKKCFPKFKEALYISWCGVNRLGDSGVNRVGDTSAFVNPAGHQLLTRRGKTRMGGVSIVFEFYTAPL